MRKSKKQHRRVRIFAYVIASDSGAVADRFISVGTDTTLSSGAIVSEIVHQRDLRPGLVPSYWVQDGRKIAIRDPSRPICFLGIRSGALLVIDAPWRAPWLAPKENAA